MKTYDLKSFEVIGEPKIEGKTYMVFDGKDFVVLPTGNRKDRRNKSTNQSISETKVKNGNNLRIMSALQKI